MKRMKENNQVLLSARCESLNVPKPEPIYPSRHVRSNAKIKESEF